jgi:hypothetical protein
MLAKIVNVVAVAAFACLVFGFVFVEAHMSQRPQSPIEHKVSANKDGPTKDKTKKEQTDEAIALYTKLLAIFTGVLAFATVGLGIATLGLYLAGERQLRLARDEFISRRHNV